MITISHEASGAPLLSRAIRGSVMMVWATPMSIHDVSSDSEPRWVTMALLFVPGARSAAWNPAAIEAITTTAATTSAMPKMARSVTFHRCRRLRTLYRIGSAKLHLPQCGCDACAVSQHRGNESRQQPQQ